MSDYWNNGGVHPDAPAGGGGPGHFRGPRSRHPVGHDSHTLAHATHHHAHLAHEAHSAAEGAEFLAHGLHRAATYAESLTKAMEIMKAHSKMARDMKLMRREMKHLQYVATESGKSAANKAKAAESLADLKAAYGGAEAEFKANRTAAAAASSLLQREHEARAALRGIAKIKLGEAVLRFERSLHTSAIGRALLRTGRVVTNPKFVKGLMIVGAALEGAAGWVDSNAQTVEGKAANAALAAGGGALVMADPIVAGADVMAPKGYKLSEVYQGTAGALTAIGEGIARGDETAMARFHERSKKGDYGAIMKAASEAGDFWAERGLMGGLSEFKEAVKYAIESWSARW